VTTGSAFHWREAPRQQLTALANQEQDFVTSGLIRRVVNSF
jgi:hypothetical protein